jgi:GDP-L-fucose synthase
MSEILVTGGTGMVGKHLQKFLPHAIYTGSNIDLTDWVAVNSLFNKIKPIRVIHLAAKVGGIQEHIEKPAEFFDENILINTHVLKARLQHSVKRFTGVLSTCIYPDNFDLGYPMREEHIFLGPPTKTNFSYGYAKRCMAVQIDAYNKQYNTKYNYLIPCNLYSEFDNFNNNKKMHFITALLKKIKDSNGELHLLGTGKPLRQFMYAEDLARVILEVIERDITSNFNVAPKFNYSIDDMVRMTLEVLGKDLEVKYNTPELDGQYRKDVSSYKMLSILPDFKFTEFKDGIKRVGKKIV